MNDETICRICGFEYDSDEPTWKYWKDDEYIPTYNLCVCCGAEFGFDDTELESVIEYRKNWISQGAKFSTPTYKGDDWSFDNQLKNIPDRWK